MRNFYTILLTMALGGLSMVSGETKAAAASKHRHGKPPSPTIAKSGLTSR